MDITSAVGKNEMYDFLIDIIPREESSADIAADSNRMMGMNPMVFFYVHIQMSVLMFSPPEILPWSIAPSSR